MIKQHFGDRLRLLRALRKLTQAELAERIDLSVDHLGRIERG